MSWRDAELAMRSDLEGMTKNAKLLWVSLAFYRNAENGQCDPGHDTLMRETHLSKHALRDARDLLQRLGVLTYTSGYSNRHDGKVSTKYHILRYFGSPKVVHTFHDDYQGDDTGTIAAFNPPRCIKRKTGGFLHPYPTPVFCSYTTYKTTLGSLLRLVSCSFH